MRKMERARSATGKVRRAGGLLALTALAGLACAAPASASHNGAVVDLETTACGATTVSASIADPAGGHVVTNMRLVVDVDGAAQNQLVPVDGSDVSIDVGPFFSQSAESETISWRVWGGGERDYDDPPFNGYGEPGFGAALNAYAASVGSFGWVVSGTDDPNPFTNWHEVEVLGCAIAKEMCKDGGYADFGFRNQGQCIRLVNTGRDSR
jgi:hypothetical protein